MSELSPDLSGVPETMLLRDLLPGAELVFNG
jgi:hypothetical protein